MGNIDIKKLNHYYGETQVLNNINLDFSNKNFISIVGPNGSGKTTFIKKILRNLKLSKNTIFLNDKDILDFKLKDYAKKIASVSQYNNINYDFSVEEIILMGRTPYIDRFKGETKKDYEVVRKVILDTDLTELKDRSFLSLSGGEKQRVVIARAIAQEPDILVLDEPINHLDIKHKLAILRLIKRLSVEKNIVVIMILHDLNFSLRYSDHCVLLRKGKVYMDGKPVNVLSKENINEVYDIKVDIIDYNKNEKMIILPHQ